MSKPISLEDFKKIESDLSSKVPASFFGQVGTKIENRYFVSPLGDVFCQPIEVKLMALQSEPIAVYLHLEKDGETMSDVTHKYPIAKIQNLPCYCIGLKESSFIDYLNYLSNLGKK